MNKIYSFFLLFLIGFTQQNYAQNNDAPRNAAFERIAIINDSIISLKLPTALSKNALAISKLPYPIIFIHGLNSSSETWNQTTDYLDSQYALSYGGRFDFCLNYDNNNAQTNTALYPATSADIALFESTTMQNGDYYYINFNTGIDGSFDPSGAMNVLSNVSAIAKQGAALKKAIERVLAITGKDKVVLVGHSMGGLASREYIQNSSLWQADNKHHVAKILFVGTPHGGSNASDSFFAFFTGIDTKSEAIRDLKTTYYYSQDPGRYLFGGVEQNSNTAMNDNSNAVDFYNIDVNCNGIIGETITGLNQRPIDNLIDYSSVIGRITGGTTDGIVDEPSSNLNQYYPSLLYPNKQFYFNSTFDFIENHTELTSKYYQILQGLDEPNIKQLAYGIMTNQNYYGFTTIQNPVAQDDDFYSFTIANASTATVNVSSIITANFNASILNNAGDLISAQNNTAGSLQFTTTLLPGNYYLKCTSLNPTNTNYQTPYQFNIATTLDNFDVIKNKFTIYPNPVNNVLQINSTLATSAKIVNTLGQEITTINLVLGENLIDVSTINSGLFFVIIDDLQTNLVYKIIKE